MCDESQRQEKMAHPRIAIRRHTDRCFHEVEEVVPAGLDRAGEAVGIRGYIIDGVMIDVEDVAEVREVLGVDGLPDCQRD